MIHPTISSVVKWSTSKTRAHLTDIVGHFIISISVVVWNVGPECGVIQRIYFFDVVHVLLGQETVPR